MRRFWVHSEQVKGWKGMHCRYSCTMLFAFTHHLVLLLPVSVVQAFFCNSSSSAGVQKKCGKNNALCYILLCRSALHDSAVAGRRVLTLGISLHFHGQVGLSQHMTPKREEQRMQRTIRAGLLARNFPGATLLNPRLPTPRNRAPQRRADAA